MSHEEILSVYGPREVMTYDVVIVGAGPGGLATAIRLKQAALEKGRDVSVCVLEKGSAAGVHILSGAVLDPRALDELLPDWRERGAPVRQPVTEDRFLFLGARHAWATPHLLLPDCFRNDGNFVISLGALVGWLAQQAEALGVEVFPGFVADEVLYDANGAVMGVATGNAGLDKDGQPTAQFQLGVAVHGKYTVFAEGARGHLGRQVIARYALEDGKDPQTYALGIKELWQASPERHRPGLVVHTAGWPLDASTYGGSFIYHGEEGRIALGFIIGLDYRNPWLDPFEEFQRFKTHPMVKRHLEGGTRLGYGARAIAAGGLRSLPRLAFPGGVLVGCEAGTLNASRIKGSHAAMKTGMLAADAIASALADGRSHDELAAYPAAFERSWLYAELQQSRNFKQWFKKGLSIATLMTGVEQWLLPKLGVRTPPWTLRHATTDAACLEPASRHLEISYPRPDGVFSFDRASSVFLSGTHHDEGQPSHLKLADPSVAVAINLAVYAGPEARYCPAGVYEFVDAASSAPRLVINASNCVHCKTCDIKDPTGNITWTAPQGGSGPTYTAL